MYERISNYYKLYAYVHKRNRNFLFLSPRTENKNLSARLKAAMQEKIEIESRNENKFILIFRKIFVKPGKKNMGSRKYNSYF